METERNTIHTTISLWRTETEKKMFVHFISHLSQDRKTVFYVRAVWPLLIYVFTLKRFKPDWCENGHTTPIYVLSCGTAYTYTRRTTDCIDVFVVYAPRARRIKILMQTL